MLVQGVADVLEPWPLKVIFDVRTGSKRIPPWLSGWMLETGDRLTVLNIAALAVIGIAVVGAISSYTQKYLSTTVAKRVGYDLRHCCTTTCNGCRCPSTSTGRPATWWSA